MFYGYDTDKGGNSACHTYEEKYIELFSPRKDNVRAVLELGIFRGGSLRAWRDYFPHAEIVGFDIEPGTLFTEERITTVLGSVRSDTDLRGLARLQKWDIIIDDASHRPIDQFLALKILWPHLVPGGIYVIEDLDLNRNGSEIITTSSLIVRGESDLSVYLGDKQADDLLILEKL